jgi:hypothetical protein
MDKLEKGEFYGTDYKKSAFENIIVTDTEYTQQSGLALSRKPIFYLSSSR